MCLSASRELHNQAVRSVPGEPYLVNLCIARSLPRDASKVTGNNTRRVGPCAVLTERTRSPSPSPFALNQPHSLSRCSLTFFLSPPSHPSPSQPCIVVSSTSRASHRLSEHLFACKPSFTLSPSLARQPKLNVVALFSITRNRVASGTLPPLCPLQKTTHLCSKAPTEVSPRLPALHKRSACLLSVLLAYILLRSPLLSPPIISMALLPQHLSRALTAHDFTPQHARLIMANHASSAVKSEDHIAKDVDTAMDEETPSGDHVEPGISIRMGPMEVDEPATNGNTNGKRKARASLTNGKSYKDASSSEDDDKPLVRLTTYSLEDSYR